jgi:ABC-type polysaccharide/polyol phosphate export permease
MRSLFRYRELIRNLVLKDLKLKYRDSVLGFLWSLANPLLLILVYSFVFGHIMREGPENFAYFLMVGILPWNFFAQSLMMSTGSILDNGNLIRKVALPMEVFPVATVLFNLAQYIFALIVFFPMALLFFKVPFAWSWVSFLPILALQLLFTLGLCFVLSAATVFYRDVRHFTEIFLTLLFWLTPIVYDVQNVPAALKMALYMNPFAHFILAYQNALYRNGVGSFDHLLVIALLAFLSFASGYTLFMLCRARFPEEA